MSERQFVGSDGRTWIVRPRPMTRHDESPDHVVLELVSSGESRYTRCLRADWDAGRVDLHALLARSVPGGASRNVHLPPWPGTGRRSFPSGR